MSPLQKFFVRILPRRWAESMEADSRSWMMRCSCGFARSIWELGGIRWKASQSLTFSFMKCPRCAKRYWHKLTRDAQLIPNARHHMNAPSKNNGALWVVLCLGLVTLENQADEFVEISAEIETFAYRLRDTNNIAQAKPKLVRVKCITGTTGWSIEHDYVVRQEWVCEGTNVVLRNDPEEATGPRHLSTLSRNGLPLGEFGVNLPWLAFCSGTYLKREGRIIALPCGVLRHCPDRFAYTDVTTTFADELGLPRTVDLFTSKARFLAAKTEWDKELSFGDRYTEWNNKTAAILQEGLLVFHYAVIESTNVLGRNFPTKFEFFQTGRPYEQMGDWYCQGIGRVKSIRPATKPPALK